MTTELFTIKPLEWEWFEDQVLRTRGYKTLQGHTFYQFQSPVDDAWSRWRWTTHMADKIEDCASPEAGKALAEEHWREYVKQGLMPTRWEIIDINGAEAIRERVHFDEELAAPIAESIRAAAERIADKFGLGGHQGEIENIISRHCAAKLATGIARTIRSMK